MASNTPDEARDPGSASCGRSASSCALSHACTSSEFLTKRTTRDVRTYALERLETGRGAVGLVPATDAGTPPKGIDHVCVEDAIDLPFSIAAADE